MIADIELPYRILQCPSCHKGTIANVINPSDPAAFHLVDRSYFDVAPAPLPMPRVANMPDAMTECWEEALRCGGSNAWTAAELMCRKLLMHIAVTQFNMDEGLQFVAYVDALDKNRYFPPSVQNVVKAIKDRGNRATHDVVSSTAGQGRATLKITHHVLHSIYELGASED